MQNSTELYKTIVLPIITRHLPNARIILYGSRARKDNRSGADIDIALDAGAAIPSSIMSAIIGDLEESNLPVLFDVVDLQAVSADMKSEIIKDGVVWKK